MDAPYTDQRKEWSAILEPGGAGTTLRSPEGEEEEHPEKGTQDSGDCADCARIEFSAQRDNTSQAEGRKSTFFTSPIVWVLVFILRILSNARSGAIGARFAEFIASKGRLIPDF